MEVVTEPGFSEGCPVTGQEAKGTTEMQKIPFKCKKKRLFYHQMSISEICFPEKLWGIHPALTGIVAKKTTFFFLKKKTDLELFCLVGCLVLL